VKRQNGKREGEIAWSGLSGVSVAICGWEIRIGPMGKSIAILGSTGSIGKKALSVVDALNSSLEKGLATEDTEDTEKTNEMDSRLRGNDKSVNSVGKKLATEDTEDRRQRSEDRGQRSEDRGQKSEGKRDSRLLRCARNDETSVKADDKYEVVALSAHSNVELLAEQVRRYRPRFVAITNADYVEQLRCAVGDSDVEILAGPGGLVKIAGLEEVDIVLFAVVGVAGLDAVLAAAKKGKTLAIANKEPLVVAGELLTKTAKESGAQLLPVDSEHSAVFQVMQAGSRDPIRDIPVPGLVRGEEVSRIILTSSGGPFREMSIEDIENVTVEQALAHPVWDMGPKITVDSATMMNKALEVIEARWLFDVPVDKIEVLIHPESIVHSLVEFVDGSVMAQLATPDMCLPIQYALTYPRRVVGIAERLRFEEIGRLTFERPNLQKFRALSLGFEVARAGGTAAAVFNAANEAGVSEFLAGRIKFVNIVELIEHCLNKHSVKTGVSLEELLEADGWARKEVKLACSPSASSG